MRTPLSPEQPKTSPFVPPRVATPRAPSPRVVSPRVASPRAPSPRVVSPRVASPRAPSPRVASPRAVSPRAPSPRIVNHHKEISYRPEPTLRHHHVSATKIQTAYRGYTVSLCFRITHFVTSVCILSQTFYLVCCISYIISEYCNGNFYPISIILYLFHRPGGASEL